MPRAPLLTPDELELGLADLPDWRLQDQRLVRQLRFPTFSVALDFVNRLRPLADEMDHHPDVAIQWGDLRITLWTHAAGGITRRDLRLARAIDELAQSR